MKLILPRVPVMHFTFLLMASFIFCHTWDKYVPYSIAVNLSPSIPEGVYLSKRPVPPELSRGEIGCFRYSASDWAKTRRYFPEGMQLCKHALGLPGDAVSVTADSLILGSGPAATSYLYAKHDRAGRELPPAAMPSTVQAHSYVMLAPAHPNSMDSRYLGVVNHSDITRTLTPIFTW